jgi:serine/threonine-protein kinase
MSGDGEHNEGSGEKPGSLAPPPALDGGRTSLPPEEDPLIGRVFHERVKIIRAIARGGMGKVYYGEQVGMGRPCAIKVLDKRVQETEGDDFAKRFLLEASVTAKLTHPNAVTIFDYGETEDGLCYIAMEYLEGRTLGQELKEKGRIDPERVIQISRQVCRALAEAHKLGVVHRDMKPANVFLMKHDDEGDYAKVLDFGLVKETKTEDPATGVGGQHTRVGQIMGSPKYMAPEQIQGKDVDGRTDIYSLGATMYAMLTAHAPFEKANEMATMMAHISEAVPAMGITAPDLLLPAGLETIVMQCLQKDPARRFASMDDLLAALKLPGGPYVNASTTSGSFMSVSPSNTTSRVNMNLAAAMAPPPPAARSGMNPLVYVIGATVVAIGGIFAFMQVRGGGMTAGASGATGATAAPPPVSVAASASSSAPAPLPPPPEPTATLHVESDPPGAKVREDYHILCEATPCDITYKGAQADPSVEHLITLLKPNYKVEKRLVHVGGDPLVVKMTKD